MEKEDIEKLMEMIYEEKTITLEPDFGEPYTLTIIDGDNTEHTHSSFYPDDEERSREENIKGCTDSFINHILRDKQGLSFA